MTQLCEKYFTLSVYFPAKDKYSIYYDVCLGPKVELKVVTEKFGLEGSKNETAKDEHYKCAKCNPFFMD
jgi:hypothetical protein